jgi:hypothetical protein
LSEEDKIIKETTDVQKKLEEENRVAEPGEEERLREAVKAVVNEMPEVTDMSSEVVKMEEDVRNMVKKATRKASPKRVSWMTTSQSKDQPTMEELLKMAKVALGGETIEEAGLKKLTPDQQRKFEDMSAKIKAAEEEKRELTKLVEAEGLKKLTPEEQKEFKKLAKKETVQMSSDEYKDKRELTKKVEEEGLKKLTPEQQRKFEDMPARIRKARAEKHELTEKVVEEGLKKLTPEQQRKFKDMSAKIKEAEEEKRELTKPAEEKKRKLTPEQHKKFLDILARIKEAEEEKRELTKLAEAEGLKTLPPGQKAKFKERSTLRLALTAEEATEMTELEDQAVMAFQNAMKAVDEKEDAEATAKPEMLVKMSVAQEELGKVIKAVAEARAIRNLIKESERGKLLMRRYMDYKHGSVVASETEKLAVKALVEVSVEKMLKNKTSSHRFMSIADERGEDVEE